MYYIITTEQLRANIFNSTTILATHLIDPIDVHNF